MSTSDSGLGEKLEFKRARFLDQIIAVNPKRKRIVMKNLSKDEKSHLTLTVLDNGEVDMHTKNEATKQYESISIPLFQRFLTVAFKDFGNFFEPFDILSGRFSKVPAILIKPPMFEVAMKKKDLIMTVKEANVLLGRVSMISERDIVMGIVDDWKVGEYYLIFHREGHSYRIPLLKYMKHVIKCLKDSPEFTDNEQSLMNFDDIDEFGIFASIKRNIKRMLFLVQPFYYKIVSKIAF